MSGFWIRVNARLADDASVRAFGRELFPDLPAWIAIEAACGLLVTLWGRVIDEQEDGDLSGRDDDAIEEWAKWRGEAGVFARAFRTAFGVGGAGLWEDRRWGQLRRDYSDRRPDIPLPVRRAVYERDEYRCVRCWTTRDLEFDHVVLWSEGGTHEVSNLRLLCWTCHRERHRHEQGARTDG